MTSYREVIDTLEQEGDLDGGAAETVRERLASHLGEADESRLIAAVAGIGAWLTSIFIVGFLLILGAPVLDDLGLLVYTAVFAGVAIWLDRSESLGGVFVSQSSLAASAAAQAIVPFATMEISPATSVMAQALVSGALYVVLSSRANRALSAFFGLGVIAVIAADKSLAGYFAVFGITIATVATVFGLPRELSWRVRRLLRPAAYVCAAFCLLMSIEPLVRELGVPVVEPAARTWILRGIAALFALGVIGFQAVEDDTIDTPLINAVTAAILALGALTSAGVFVSLLVAALGFWKLNRVLIVMGGLGLAGHLAIYYEQLDLTLLHKSIVLVFSGLILLGIYWWHGRLDREEAR